MIAGELQGLLERCRAEDAIAWADFVAWVKRRARAVLSVYGKLSETDREDIVADTLKSLVPVIRRREIRGVSNSEIDAYVCQAIKNRALNLFRGYDRRRQAGESSAVHAAETSAIQWPDAVDEGPSQDVQVVIAEQLERAEKSLMSWSAADRYLFTARLNGVASKVIQETLRQPPFELHAELATIDTRFYRLRRRLAEEISRP